MENREKGRIYWKLLAYKMRGQAQVTNQVSGRIEQEAGTSGTPIFGVLLARGATPTAYFCASAKPPEENLIGPAGSMGLPLYQLVLSDYREEDTSLESIRRTSPEDKKPPCSTLLASKIF